MDPRSIYRQGVRFLIGDGVLRTQVTKDPDLAEALTFPGIVCNTFAAEMFFKCLLMLDGKSESREHDLFKLYDALSDDMKVAIKAEWAVMLSQGEQGYKDLEARHGVTIPRDLETSLSECGNAFVKMRYQYEEPGKYPFYMTHLPLVLQKVIFQLKGWPPKPK